MPDSGRKKQGQEGRRGKIKRKEGDRERKIALHCSI